MGKKPLLLRVLILAILIKEGKLHGYLLYKKILQHTRMRWKPSIGTIYHTLNEMVKEGLVSKHAENRKYNYVITSEGIEYFIKNSRTPAIRMAGVLATILEAYLKIPKANSVLTKDLRERLMTLKKIFQEYGI